MDREFPLELSRPRRHHGEIENSIYFEYSTLAATCSRSDKNQLANYPRASSPEVLTCKSDEWAELAERAIARLDSARFGDREPIYLEFAREYTLHPHIVRRLVSARRFLFEIEKDLPDLAQKLAAMPFTAIEPIRKWYEYDRPGALAVARELIGGQRTVRSIIADEKAARPQPRSISEMSVREWEEYAIQIIERRLPPGYLRAPLGDMAGSAIDCVLRPSKHKGKSYALIIVGPYNNPALYQRRQAEVLMQAIAAAHLGFEVIVAVPDRKVTNLYSEWLGRQKIKGIEIQSISEPRIRGRSRLAANVGA